MVPLGLKGNLIAAAAIAVVAFGAGFKVATWRSDAARTAAVEAAVEAYRERLAQAQAAAQVDREADAATSRLLEDIRRERDMALEELAARPTLTRTITKVIANGSPCSCPVLDPDFRRLWNQPAARPDRGPAPTSD